MPESEQKVLDLRSPLTRTPQHSRPQGRGHQLQPQDKAQRFQDQI